MITDTVTYSASVEGFELEEELNVSPPEFEIEKIAFKTKKSDEIVQIEITVTLKDIFASDKFGSITNPAVERILNRIALRYDIVYIGKPRCSGYSLLERTGSNVSSVLRTHISLWDHLVGTYRPGEEERKQLKAYLEKSNLFPGENLYGLFNYSNRQKDPVTRFMFLYNILLSLYNDTQSDVDAFILTEELRVITIQRTYLQNGKQKTKLLN